MPNNNVEFEFAAISAPVARQPWVVQLRGIPPRTHSIVLELYGENGGIMRTFPRGRDTLQIDFELPRPGRTELAATARDDQLHTIVQVASILDVIDPGAAKASSAQGPYALPVMRGRTLPIMQGANKPPYGFTPPRTSGYVRSGAASAAPVQSPGYAAAPPSPLGSARSDLGDLLNAKTNALMSRLKKP